MSGNDGTGEVSYSAKEAYLDGGQADEYETVRFSGKLGTYRWRREQDAISGLVERLPGKLDVLDIPCGIGRWWPVLERRAANIIGADISPAMRSRAARRVGETTVPVELVHGDAEQLEMEDGSVDLVFSHALTKHLPIPVQYRAISEFARVTRRWVICSFSIVDSWTYPLWRRRSIDESYPLLPEQLSDLAGFADLNVLATARCTTPVGVERSVLLEKKRDASAW